MKPHTITIQHLIAFVDSHLMVTCNHFFLTGFRVACEENNCKFVWFHINCVGLDETLMNDVQ